MAATVATMWGLSHTRSRSVWVDSGSPHHLGGRGLLRGVQGTPAGPMIASGLLKDLCNERPRSTLGKSRVGHLCSSSRTWRPVASHMEETHGTQGAPVGELGPSRWLSVPKQQLPPRRSACLRRPTRESLRPCPARRAWRPARQQRRHGRPFRGGPRAPDERSRCRDRL